MTRRHIARLAVALALVMPTGATVAQQREFFDSSGRVSARSITDTNGATTYVDAGGKVSGRTTTSGNQTTIYDNAGRKIGSVTTQTGR